MAALYGEKAAAEYRQTARPMLQSTMVHPNVDAFAAYDGETVAGLLFSLTRGRMAQLSFLHVLRRYSGSRAEDALATEAVAALRSRGIDGIVCEVVALCPLRLDGVFERLGFERIERMLMAAPLDSPALAETGTASVPFTAGDHSRVAETIVDAYQGHPGRFLHAEVRSPGAALAFLESAASGAYGTVRDTYRRAIWRGHECAGIIVGCQAGPKTGFVLQVAVRRGCQRQGLGADLVRGLAEAFRCAGLERIVLGVTVSNPARRLYARLDFEPLRPVNAYTWWRTEPVA